MKVIMETLLLHRAKSATKHHSNPYIESTTVLSDNVYNVMQILCIITSGMLSIMGRA